MATERTTWTQLASALLGVAAAGSVGLGLLLIGVGATAGDFFGTSLGSAGAVGAVVIGVLAAGFGLVAAYAALGVWAGRASARAVGLLVGAIAVLAPVAARLSEGWHDVLWISAGLGALLLAALLLDRPATSGTA